MQGEEPLIQGHILALEDGDEKELDPSQADDDIDIPQGLEEDIGLVIPTKQDWASATLRCKELAPIARLLLGQLDDAFVDRAHAQSLIDKHGLSIKKGIIINNLGVK